MEGIICLLAVGLIASAGAVCTPPFAESFDVSFTPGMSSSMQYPGTQCRRAVIFEFTLGGTTAATESHTMRVNDVGVDNAICPRDAYTCFGSPAMDIVTYQEVSISCFVQLPVDPDLPISLNYKEGPDMKFITIAPGTTGSAQLKAPVEYAYVTNAINPVFTFTANYDNAMTISTTQFTSDLAYCTDSAVLGLAPIAAFDTCVDQLSKKRQLYALSGIMHDAPVTPRSGASLFDFTSVYGVPSFLTAPLSFATSSLSDSCSKEAILAEGYAFPYDYAIAKRKDTSVVTVKKPNLIIPNTA